MAIDYKAVLLQAIIEFRELLKRRQELELKLAQKEQFVRATMYQLPDEDRARFEDLLDTIAAGSAGLSASIRAILSGNPRKWHTATQVRDALKKSGFDFGNYASNPLASVHSALKRLKTEDAEMTTVDGVMAWRWKGADKPRLRFSRRNPFASGPMISLGTLAGTTKPNEFWSQIVKDAIKSEKK